MMSTSSSYKQFAHLQIPFKDLLSGTNNLTRENVIGSDWFGYVYKGQLFSSGQFVNIKARRLRKTYGLGNKEFWKEVSMLSTLEHQNIESIIGFCDEDEEKIVITKLPSTHGNLYNNLIDPTLTWMKRLQICVGVAHALSYIYHDKGRDFSIIHRNIMSNKILLDEQWQPKLCGFEYSVTQTTSRRDRLCLIDIIHGTMEYSDPTYLESGSVTHKSDIYSFGIILFEVLCGKKVTTIENVNALTASSARSHYEGGRLKDMIDPVLWKQMHTKSFNIFSETAYYCIKEQRSQRPNIYQIVIKLEQALKSQQEHDNSLISKASLTVDGMTIKNFKEKGLTHLEIPFTDIKVATKDFDKEYLIGSGTFGNVYKAELDHFDNEKLLPAEEKSIGILPKKHSIVAIKRIKIREDEEGEKGFLAEIEMLSRCKHSNIISLLGFCAEGSDMILVYEHASKGSLSDYLGITSNLDNLSWVQRIKICIDIAHGLHYLHTDSDDKRRIIHRDIKGDNILLNENLQAKIADFGLSKFRPENQQVNKNTIYTKNIAGTDYYMDPEYAERGKLKIESDIYSLGVVLFELLSGRLAYDAIYTKENSNGIAHVARRHFNEGTIREMVDPRILEETYENMSTLNRGPDQNSLKVFAEIAYRCVAESQAQRPPMEDVIKKLEEALFFQENIKEQLKFSVEEIAFATQNFSDNNLIGQGEFGKIYKGEFTHVVANGCNNYVIAAKRLHSGRKYGAGEKAFLMELQILLEYKHENIIGLVGYCNEKDEKIIVYEYASGGNLDKHLDDKCLTWMKRLQICIDIASVLDFLQRGGGGVTEEVVIHRDIKSSNVLLTHDWKAKIIGFGTSLLSSINKDMDFVIDDVVGTSGYADPYSDLGFLMQESDIYSLGVVLFEILCGRLAIISNYRDMHSSLPLLVKQKFKEGKLEEIVFEGIKEQIASKSFTTFVTLAYECLHPNREERPKTGKVLQRLKEALESQEDYDTWKPKLPKDYENLIQMSNSRDINYSTEKYKDLYDMFSKGILLQEGKVLFSLDGNGERNEMISATKFSYKHRWSHKWRTVQKSRFHKVAEMIDMSNLKIQVKIKPQFLSPGVNYGVHLVFRFCGPRQFVGKRMYVDLKYKMGSETLHTYFATMRDDGWMTIELCRVWNHNKNNDFEFSLESFARCYIESRCVYVEGIEFRAIDNVKQEEIKENQQLMPTTSEKVDNNDEGEKLLLPNKVNKKKHCMVSAKEALYEYANVKLSDSIHSTQSRSQEVIELQRQQVLRIKCKIESHSLSPDTDYACYLVFQLSEKCHGLHCPVIVRDLLQKGKKKEKGVLYFRFPSPCNVNDTNRVPEEREDGRMEVNVWKFNSSLHLRNDCISVSLKLISYKGTMSGLIVCGIEMRPM